eukprot:6190531-Pleurochrysis_carterae.AAC.2
MQHCSEKGNSRTLAERGHSEAVLHAHFIMRTRAVALLLAQHRPRRSSFNVRFRCRIPAAPYTSSLG